MKKIFLASLLLFGTGNAFQFTTNRFEGTAEKNGVLVQYKTCSKYKNIAFGLPYCIQITNTTATPITVSPSLIATPLISYQEMERVLRNTLISGLVLTPLAVTGAYGLYRLAMEGKKNVWRGVPFIVIGSALWSAYLLYSFPKIKRLDKDMLHEPVTIQPGELVKKLFWVRNPKDPIKINFDTIQIL